MHCLHTYLDFIDSITATRAGIQTIWWCTQKWVFRGDENPTFAHFAILMLGWWDLLVLNASGSFMLTSPSDSNILELGRFRMTYCHDQAKWWWCGIIAASTLKTRGNYSTSTHLEPKTRCCLVSSFVFNKTCCSGLTVMFFSADSLSNSL